MGCLLYSQIVDKINAKKIEDRIIISPHLDKEQFGKDNIDIRLSNDIIVPSKTEIDYLNLLSEPTKYLEIRKKYTNNIKLDYGESFTIHPGEFIIANSFEYICLPKDITGILQGRSSWGRFGLIVHATAGIIHPEFQGTLTFELSNLGPVPIKLYPLMRVAQLIFFEDSGDLGKLKYKSQYSKSVKSKMPELESDYDYQILKNLIKEKDEKNL